MSTRCIRNGTGKFLVPYETLKELLPQRFDLNILDQIFQSWRKDVSMEKIRQTTSEKSAVIYEHDHHLYQSDMYIFKYSKNGKDYENLCIKLANNGFLYSLEADMKTTQTNIPRHHSNTWARLGPEHASSFEHIFAFCKEYFGCDGIYYELLYNAVEDRFDFKAFQSSVLGPGIVITFEPFYPCDGDFDTHHWLVG